MTQEHILVSPLTSACPKPGTSKTPAFRPADPGDTAAPSSTGEVCLSPRRPFRAACPSFRYALRLCVRIPNHSPIPVSGTQIRPQFAKRTSHFGQLFRGGLGKPNQKFANQTSVSPLLYRTFLLCTAKPNFSANRRIQPKMKP